MIGLIDLLTRPLLQALDPEQGHALAVRALRLLPPLPPRRDDPALAVRAFGLDFPNPVGLAAGFDKHGEVPDALLKLGFGFVEVGTVTLRPQPGNPRPRLFRLPADVAVINRMGFNSEGAEAVGARLRTRRARRGIVGVNIGANKDSVDRIADYAALVGELAPAADYLTVNVSSPNTPGLRDLQQAAALDDLLARVIEARDETVGNSRAAGGRPLPLLLKIAPDLSLAGLDDVVQIARSRRVDGMIVGNTTVSRPGGLRDAAAAQAGGLSGRPLFPLATRMLAETYVRVERAFPLIGVGGIDSGAAALAKIRAGADLLQLYSALVFRGLGLVGAIKRELRAALQRERAARLGELVGLDAAAETAQPWPA